ncbi:hypothetical protein CEXT_540641 [Caerostris extrusa]|uniref:Uncharacterized protein n=1 Tax=Caerostris extrusa TaxID=172846 RepID=A0AAV4XMH8_CAEEX|nr:hypothetical protein CEXT_540641 [Caerostris extrusa]
MSFVSLILQYVMQQMNYPYYIAPLRTNTQNKTLKLRAKKMIPGLGINPPPGWLTLTMAINLPYLERMHPPLPESGNHTHSQ